MKNKEIKWIISYLNRYPIMFIATVLGSIIEILLYSSPSLIVAKIIKLFMDKASNLDIILWIIYLLVLVIVQAIIFYLVALVNEIHAHRVTTDMTADLYRVLQSRPLYYHDSIKIGDVMARATGDTRIINIGLSPAVRIIIQVATLLIGSLSVFIYINWKLSIILLISFPLYAYFVYTYSKKLGPVSIQLREEYGELSINSHETFRGINEIKSYTAEKMSIESFARISKNHADYIRKFGILASFYPPTLIISISLGLTAIYGMYLISINQLSFPEFVIFIGLISTILFMSRRIRMIADMTTRMIASAQRIQNMMEDKIEPLEFGLKQFNGVEDKILFKDVSFRYKEGREWALRNINISINKNETIAIIGGPGSGKSTFIKLLLRLYDPQEGEIYIDDDKIKQYTRKSLRDQISSIEQEIFLFSDTISGNIAFGKPDAEFKDIIIAAKLARADDFIITFTNDYDTMVGERGITLSGGQKQRIAIARSLLINPSILIMDDASSALDAKTEAMIQDAIKNILKTRTSIITTHRLSIIADADKVIVFDKGKIVAEGKHQDILKTSIHYRRLFESLYELPPLEEMR